MSVGRIPGAAGTFVREAIVIFSCGTGVAAVFCHGLGAHRLVPFVGLRRSLDRLMDLSEQGDHVSAAHLAR